MYLTEIAEGIVTAIETSSPGNWEGGLVLPDDLPIFSTLDPLTTTAETEKGVYVIPSYNEFDFQKNRDTSRGRRPVTVPRTRRIIVAICHPLSQILDTSEISDVAPKDFWVPLSNLREDLEIFLQSMNISGLELVDMESEPPDEAALDERLFLAATVLGFKECARNGTSS